MKKLAVSAAALLAGTALILGGAYWALNAAMPPYRDTLGDDNHLQKLKGLYLLEQSAEREDNLIILGSSELRTKEISTHPANFFEGKRSGFQVNLIGRGSCQSLTHAIVIAASGDVLRGKKVALITSPQGYVKDGIAPDLFMANFSEQQYLALLDDPGLSDDIKAYISARVKELAERYAALTGAAPADIGLRYKAEHISAPSAATAVRDGILAPYYALGKYLLNLKDMALSREQILLAEDASVSMKPAQIDWGAELRSAVAEAEAMTANNTFGFLDDYYTTYIGNRLFRQQNKDATLSYSVSKEYDDLRLLFEVCRQKGIEPLFIHPPLHGDWSDYTGFASERRQQYYSNVSQIAEEYGVQTLDLTGKEYEQYFLCDVMHLGWKGWLEIDKALIEYYHGS